MDRALQVVSIIVSVVLVILVLMQAKGSGLGDLLGGGGESGGITRTRRGLEKTLFQITVALGFVFLLVAILSFAFNS
jgi:preprotein translocase subunit SecG